MSERSKYKTKQREMMIDYLASSEDAHITAGDVCEYFRSRGANIGQSTVYRQLEGLVDEGIVNKYLVDGNSPACFEFVKPGEHAASVCFHCKCEKCGKLIHMHCEELEGIAEHLFADHRFRLNPMRTVFYGVCEDCA